MRLPVDLLEAIERATGKVDRPKLMQAAAQLTRHYQAADFTAPAITTDAQRAAYLAVRFPATYAANRRVFAEIGLRAPETTITSLLDLGAGPGTTLLAAIQEFPSLQQATLLEADDHWITLGIALEKTLVEQSRMPVSLQTRWLRHDLRSGFSRDVHDLVVLSYALGELPAVAAEAVLRQAWNCTAKHLVVIEPGTRRGFANIDAARSALLASGAEILAPCPHQHACPMAAAGDWCHFSQRVDRSSQHRQLKGGALGYEDEKFSYIVATRQAHSSSGSRVVRHPGKHSGHIQLTLCTFAGQLENKTVTRSDKPAYKLARKTEWGDAWTE